jgi:hypothetical protein
MLNDRLRTQVLANKLVERFQARDEKRRDLQNLDTQQMKEYQNFVEGRRKARNYQASMSQAYRDQAAVGQRLLSSHRDVRGLGSPMMHSPNREVTTPIGRTETVGDKQPDFNLDHGILYPFFQKEMHPNHGNEARNFVKGALKKQRAYENEYFKHVEKRSHSINRP